MAISFVAVVATNSSKVTATSISLTVPAGGVAAGDLVVVYYSAVNSSSAVAFTPTFSDTKSNTWTRIDGNVSGSPRPGTGVGWSVLTTALVSGNTITVTFDNSFDAIGVGALQFTGNATSPADVSAKAGVTTSTAADSGATATTAQADELLVGAIGVNGPTGDTYTQNGDGQAGTYQVPANSRAGTTGAAAASNATANIMYEIVSATAAYSARATLGTSRAWLAQVATFKAAAAGRPPQRTVPLGRRERVRQFGPGG